MILISDDVKNQSKDYVTKLPEIMGVYRTLADAFDKKEFKKIQDEMSSFPRDSYQQAYRFFEKNKGKYDTRFAYVFSEYIGQLEKTNLGRERRILESITGNFRELVEGLDIVISENKDLSESIKNETIKLSHVAIFQYISILDLISDVTAIFLMTFSEDQTELELKDLEKDKYVHYTVKKFKEKAFRVLSFMEEIKKSGEKPENFLKNLLEELKSNTENYTVKDMFAENDLIVQHADSSSRLKKFRKAFFSYWGATQNFLSIYLNPLHLLLDIGDIISDFRNNTREAEILLIQQRIDQLNSKLDRMDENDPEYQKKKASLDYYKRAYEEAKRKENK